jgi:hypothetical protein
MKSALKYCKNFGMSHFDTCRESRMGKKMIWCKTPLDISLAISKQKSK